MDMPRSEGRDLRFDQFSVTKHLAHASAQARARNYQDFLIVDVDSHHHENESYKELFTYIENPVIRRAALESTKRPGRSSMMNAQVGSEDLGGRITRHELREFKKVPADTQRDIIMTQLWMDAMGRTMRACSRPRCCFSASIPKSRSKWRWRRPIIAGSASASLPSRRGSSRCSTCRSTIRKRRLAPCGSSATRRASST